MNIIDVNDVCLTLTKTEILKHINVSFEEGKLGSASYDRKTGEFGYVFTERIEGYYHGTGDVYAAAFVGALLNERDAYEAAVIAADYTVKCIEATQGDPDHWYGVKFEAELPAYLKLLGK